MADECTFTLHQVDQARTDFAIIEDHLEAIYARLARVPTRVDLARTGCDASTRHPTHYFFKMVSSKSFTFLLDRFLGSEVKFKRS